MRNITQYEVTVTPKSAGDSRLLIISAEAGAIYNVTGLRWAATYDIDFNVVIHTDGQGELTYDIGVPHITINTSSGK